MADVGKILSLLGVTFLIMGLIINITPKFPLLPGDLYINKGGLKIYIPFASAIIVSVILTLFFNFFRK